jgi:hypothetical protein
MILGKKIKILGKLHGGMSIAAVFHKPAINILKSEESICASVKASARISPGPRGHPSTVLASDHNVTHTINGISNF